MDRTGCIWYLLLAAMILSLAYSVGGHFLLRPMAIAAVIGFVFLILISFLSRFF